VLALAVASNQIRDVTLRPVAADAGDSGGHALFIALDVGEPSRLLGFLEEVVGRFMAERVTGPPDTHFMLITAIGEVSAAEFADTWRSAIANDARARALLGTMRKADVMQGDAHGHMVGQASLLAS
jgi:hypothetical protein